MRNLCTLKLSALLFLFAVVFTSCEKDADAPEEETPVTPITPPPAKFTWTVGGAPAATAEEMYYIPAFSNIYASKSNGSSVDITLEDLDTGTHAISSSNGITLVYATSSSTMNASSGSVVITENMGSLVSGTFTCALSGGGASSTIKGEYSYIPKK